MSDSIACKKCFATVETSNLGGHEDWHRTLDEKIQSAVKSGVATAGADRVRAQRNTSMGGRPV